MQVLRTLTMWWWVQLQQQVDTPAAPCMHRLDHDVIAAAAYLLAITGCATRRWSCTVQVCGRGRAAGQLASVRLRQVLSPCCCRSLLAAGHNLDKHCRTRHCAGSPIVSMGRVTGGCPLQSAMSSKFLQHFWLRADVLRTSAYYCMHTVHRERMERLRDVLGWTTLETDEDKQWRQIFLH